jgi:hypothetical protein
MELDYKNYSVRIVHNPNDVIIRFTDNTSMRIWEARLTERDFIEVQVLGGLEFAISVLKGVLMTDSYTISDFKDTPKQLSFTVQYMPAHAKQINLDFLLPAIKRESANADVETIFKRLISLEKDLSEQKVISSTLRNELDEQTEKTSGYIVLGGCPFTIHEDIVNLMLGLINTSDQLTGQSYAGGNLVDIVNSGRYYFNSLKNLNNLKFLKKCHTLRIVNAEATDFSPISEMTSLTSISIVYSSANRNLTNIKWITKLTNLQSITVHNCIGILDIIPLTELKNLKTLDIRGSGVANTSMLSSSIAITR